MSTDDFLEWRSEFATGVAECDADHAKIIQAINRIHSAVKFDRPASALDGLLAELVRYTDEHFHREDPYLETLPPEAAKAHRRQHIEMATWTRGIWLRRRGGGQDVSQEVLTRLRKWWTGHIMALDQTYAKAVEAAPNRVDEAAP